MCDTSQMTKRSVYLYTRCMQAILDKVNTSEAMYI